MTQESIYLLFLRSHFLLAFIISIFNVILFFKFKIFGKNTKTPINKYLFLLDFHSIIYNTFFYIGNFIIVYSPYYKIGQYILLFGCSEKVTIAAWLMFISSKISNGHLITLNLVTKYYGLATLINIIATYILTLFTNPKSVYEDMAYLGFDANMKLMVCLLVISFITTYVITKRCLRSITNYIIKSKKKDLGFVIGYVSKFDNIFYVIWFPFVVHLVLVSIFKIKIHANITVFILLIPKIKFYFVVISLYIKFLHADIIHNFLRYEIESKYYSILFHELRNPLQGIIGLCEMINVGTDSKDAQNNAKISINQAYHMLSIIDGTLEDMRLTEESKNYRTTDYYKDTFKPYDQIVDLITLFKSRYPSIQYMIRCSKDFEVKFHKRHFIQILTNLISNSSKSIGRFTNGTIEVIISNNFDKQSMEVCVKDNGCGVSKKMQDKIQNSNQMFEGEFNESFGIGMKYLLNILRTIGSKLTIVSNPKNDRGTEISFTVICSQKQVIDESSKKHQVAGLKPIDGRTTNGTTTTTTATNGAKFKILHIEDDPLIRKIMRFQISKRLDDSFSLTSLTSGEECIEYLKKESVNLLIVDENLGDNLMLGSELIKIVSRIYPEIVVFNCTANCSDHDISYYKSIGSKETFPKPVNFELLIKSTLKLKFKSID